MRRSHKIGPIVNVGNGGCLVTIMFLVIGFGAHIWWPFWLWLLLTFSVTLRGD